MLFILFVLLADLLDRILRIYLHPGSCLLYLFVGPEERHDLHFFLQHNLVKFSDSLAQFYNFVVVRLGGLRALYVRQAGVDLVIASSRRCRHFLYQVDAGQSVHGMRELGHVVLLHVRINHHYFVDAVVAWRRLVLGRGHENRSGSGLNMLLRFLLLAAGRSLFFYAHVLCKKALVAQHVLGFVLDGGALAEAAK